MSGVRKRGTVVAVDPEGISVRVSPESADRCDSCGACGAPAPSGERTLRATPDVDVAVGDEVLVETAPVSHLAASLLLLLVPLLGLLTGAGLGLWVGRELSLGGEAGSIGGGLMFLVLSYLGVVLIDRHIRRRRRTGPSVIVLRDAARHP